MNAFCSDHSGRRHKFEMDTDIGTMVCKNCNESLSFLDITKVVNAAMMLTADEALERAWRMELWILGGTSGIKAEDKQLRGYAAHWRGEADGE